MDKIIYDYITHCFAYGKMRVRKKSIGGIVFFGKIIDFSKNMRHPEFSNIEDSGFFI